MAQVQAVTRGWGAALALASALLLGVWARPARAERPPQVVRLAAAVGERTPWAEALQRYKRAVEARAAGRLEVRLFLGAQLGGELEALRRCRRGELQAVATSAGGVAPLVPEAAALQLWGLVKHPEELDRLLAGELAGAWQRAFAATGLTLGFWLDSGPRHLASRARPLRSPADLKGLRMYAADAAAPHEPWQAFGALAMPLPPAEVPRALQSAVLDGFDQTLAFAVAARWHEGVRFVTLTGHAQPPVAVVFDRAWFAALPEDLQAVLLQEGQQARLQLRQRLLQRTPTFEAVLRGAAVELIVPTAAERAAFDKAGLAMRAAFRKRAKPAALRMLEQLEAALRR